MTLPTDYAYAVYRIRALEPKLLNSNEVERMVDAKDATDAYRILNELDYAVHVGDIDNIASFEEVINAGLLDTKALLRKITPQKWVLHILWYRYDTHNIKTLLKAKKAGKSEEEIEKFLMPLGNIEIEKLKTYILQEENTKFDIYKKDEERFKAAIKDAKTLYEKHKEDPQMIDLILDKNFFELALNTAKETKREFLINFIKKSIDIANIQAFLRLKLSDRPKEILENGLIDSGTIEKSLFLDHFEKDIQEFISTMKHTDFSSMIEQGINYWHEHKSFLELEKLLENHRTKFIKKAKTISFGPEPLFAYFWAKKNNALIIRMIMVCKLSEVDSEEIRERLRELYV